MQFLSEKRAEILQTIRHYAVNFAPQFPQHFLHIFHFFFYQQCENSTEKFIAESLLFFSLGRFTYLLCSNIALIKSQYY